MKKVLAIAGSDCSGGAGIEADLKTFAAHGVYGMSVIVSVVAENTFHVIDSQNIRPEIIEKQIDAVFEDIGVDSVKIGMLPNAASMNTVAQKLREYRPPHVVIDPVMVATSGSPLMDGDAIDFFTENILPLADLLTPNIPESERIAQISVKTDSDMERAAKLIHRMGAKNVLIKGGHTGGDAVDIFFDGKQYYRFCAERIKSSQTHGTGCTLSSAIAANLALGFPMVKAAERAKKYVTTAILHSLSIGKGSVPIHHFYNLYRYGLNKGEDYEN